VTFLALPVQQSDTLFHKMVICAAVAAVPSVDDEWQGYKYKQTHG
jgi:hypothetical protein